MIARLTPDSTRVEIIGERHGYRADFAVADLPRWLTFYRKLRDRRGGAYARFYAETVRNLESVQAEIGRKT